MKPPHNSSALPPAAPITRAAPQCISGRTSYLRVRLAFHPDPQLIRAVCNPHRFGPPRPVTAASPWPWVAHAVSGLPAATNALFRLAFAVAAAVTALTRPLRVTRRIILQKARRQGGLRPTPSTAWKRTVSGSLSLPSPGCFSPFPHGTVRYRSLCVFSLGRWAAQLPARLHVPGGTQVPHGDATLFPLPGCHGLWQRIPDAFAYSFVIAGRRQTSVCGPTTPCPQRLPPWHGHGLGCSRFARHYYGNAFFSSGYVRWFSSPGSLRRMPVTAEAVGLPHSEIVGSQPACGSPTLIAAQPRPSSAHSAEASTIRSSCLPCGKPQRDARHDARRLTTAREMDKKIAFATVCTW